MCIDPSATKREEDVVATPLEQNKHHGIIGLSLRLATMMATARLIGDCRFEHWNLVRHRLNAV
ncbi:MAG: hypothetical protein OJF50_000697 [Nitrospira sp.]|nr:hypothetical protein [Nitrospira sp.]